MTLKPLAALLLLVVTGAKADGPVVPWPAQVGEPAVTLANGVTLELLGIADGTSPRRNGGRRTERRSRRRRRASGRASRDVTPMAQWNFALRA